MYTLTYTHTHSLTRARFLFGGIVRGAFFFTGKLVIWAGVDNTSPKWYLILMANTVSRGELSVRQRFFVDIFEGDGAAAVLAAGYKCKNASVASGIASRLLCNPKIQRALAQKIANLDSAYKEIRKEHQKKLRELRKIKLELAEMDAEVLKGHVATKRERQVFWTRIMMDENEKMPDRLRASELLGKSELDFGEQKVTNQSLNMGVAFIANQDIREMISEITGVALPAPEIKVPEKAPVIDITPQKFESELPPEKEPDLKEAIGYVRELQGLPPEEPVEEQPKKRKRHPEEPRIPSSILEYSKMREKLDESA